MNKSLKNIKTKLSNIANNTFNNDNITLSFHHLSIFFSKVNYVPQNAPTIQKTLPIFKKDFLMPK